MVPDTASYTIPYRKEGMVHFMVPYITIYGTIDDTMYVSISDSIYGTMPGTIYKIICGAIYNETNMLPHTVSYFVTYII